VPQELVGEPGFPARAARGPKVDSMVTATAEAIIARRIFCIDMTYASKYIKRIHESHFWDSARRFFQ
jgi:hypothetical protein